MTMHRNRNEEKIDLWEIDAYKKITSTSNGYATQY